MMFELHTYGGHDIVIHADEDGLIIQSRRPEIVVERRETWPPELLSISGAWKTAIEIEQLLELGLAVKRDNSVVIPYDDFSAIESAEIGITKAWVQSCPFRLRIDRRSDIGRLDFRYRYDFLSSGRPISIDRLGYYVRHGKNCYRIDTQTYALVEAMDRFNRLPHAEKTQQESWLTFSKVKGCAEEVGAQLDRTLASNEVVVPSSIGLSITEDPDGSISFLPTCPELKADDFRSVFERNQAAQGLYSIDRPGLGRTRIVLTDRQQEVVKRMKRVQRLKGPATASLKENPAQVFDGVLDSVELPYSDRVIGIGAFQFVSTPKAVPMDVRMADLWKGSHSDSDHAQSLESTAALTANGSYSPHANGESNPIDQNISDCAQELGTGVENAVPDSGTAALAQGGASQHPQGKFLLIETHEDSIPNEIEGSRRSTAGEVISLPYLRPAAFKEEFSLEPHQESGVSWLQTCVGINERFGVLLADDMGLGKTLQVLSFLAWAIESKTFPDLDTAPFRPILVIVPLILLENRTWETEMDRFFQHGGSIFMPVLNLYGERLRALRAQPGKTGRETQIGHPVLDLDEIQRHRVVITNYETVTNYQHSFAYLRNGKSLWSAIVTDEAQEYKTPNTKISHAIKALKADFQIANTGTPVENRLLDLWNLFDSIQPGLLRSAQEFRKRYEEPIQSGDHGGPLGELKRELLFQRPHAFLLRRNKSEVKTLPAKTIVRLPCTMSAHELELHKGLIQSLHSRDKKNRHLSLLHDFARLYQHPALLSDNPDDIEAEHLRKQSSKLQTVLRVLHEIRCKREKAIIFTRHRQMQSILAKVLQAEFGIPVRIINGETHRSQSGPSDRGASSRAAILDEFRSRAGFNLLILSPHVAGVGLTITEANHVIHYGRWWNPAVEGQSTDRAYRIGQKKDVFVYLPILEDNTGAVPLSFDQRLDKLMEKKYQLSEDFLRPLVTEGDLGNELCTGLVEEASVN
jgi:hypothetical protein